MQPYEVMVMFAPEAEEPRRAEIIARVRQIAEQAGGTFQTDDVWGMRKLAYEIDHKGEALYHVLSFDTTSEALDEISRVLRITDEVLRHMAVRRVEQSGAETDTPAPVA